MTEGIDRAVGSRELTAVAQETAVEIKSIGQTLGAQISGIDLGQPLSDADLRPILRALGS